MPDSQTGLEASANEADSKPATGSAEEPVVECSKKAWVEVELLDYAGGPVADERCELIDADGDKHLGKTTAKGTFRFEGIAEGQCKFTFPGLDTATWKTREANGADSD